MKKKCALVLFFNCFSLDAESLKGSFDVRVLQVNQQQSQTGFIDIDQIAQPTIIAIHTIRLPDNSDDLDEMFLGSEYITYFENPSFDPNC